MAKNDFSVNDLPENYENKCLCVLVLDVSGSMRGEPIEELNKGLEVFFDDIRNDETLSSQLEICIIEFCDYVECIIEPSLVSNVIFPELKANGTTKMVDAVRMAISKIKERKEYYKKTGQPYYRPWIILMTDGGPDDDQDIDNLAIEIRASSAAKQFRFFPVGVRGADMRILEKISDSSMPPAPLEGLKFSAFFTWLSKSMQQITSSLQGEKVDLERPTDWMSGLTVD